MALSNNQDPTPELPWPEPLVIELIGEHLESQPLTFVTRRSLARQHAAALRDMLAGRDPTWPTSRLRLSERYDELGITAACTASIDRAVIFELAHIVADRFRTSPRRRHEAAQVLRAAVAKLPATVGPACRAAA